MDDQTEPVTTTCRVLNMTPNYMAAFWIACRNCYFKGQLEELENKYTEDAARNLFKKIVLKNHDSVLEHITLQIALSGIPRSVMAQLTRHRHVTFHISSQHFQDHSDFCYIIPDFENSDDKYLFISLMTVINDTYKDLIKNGVPHYIAREVLPNAAACKIVMTVNLRELRHIIKVRQGPENTPNMQDTIRHIKDSVNNLDPILLYGLGE